ncbi:hypothetical protein RHMOL_Rhmol06G0152400 [Rhododendron molle]|uniref:Uncharacterized protein n=1 Tax=Rhododendron molle TaxID=49168 RepID=A0ACC0NCQ0_RHOML|nr:hypothetical protein RHMOL_Rhmol06G0152400 [Rhododendron molle]
MAENNGNGDGGDVINHSEDCGGPMVVETEDQTREGAVAGTSVVAASGGNGGEGQQQEVAGKENHHATKAEPRATEENGAVGSSIEPVGSGIAAEGTPVVGGSAGGAGGSDVAGDDVEPIGSPPRDPARGKGAAVKGEETTEIPVTYREEDVQFRPVATAATSLSHIPITKYDVAEHLPDEMLANLLEDNP